MKKEILKGIVEKIKNEKIRPEPKWKLRLKSYFFWLLFAGMIFFGTLFFSLIIFNILDLDLGLIFLLKFKRSINLVMNVFPYLWLFFLFLFLFLGSVVFRKTRKGYRYKSIFIVSFILAGIFFLGTVVHLSRMDKKMDEVFFRKTPSFFRERMPFRENRLKNPQNGFLAGEIINLESEKFLIKNFKGENWEVIISSKTQLRGNVKIKNQEKIFVIGEKIGENLFEAFLIRPLEPPHFFERRR